MSFTAHYCPRCGQEIKEGSAGHLFGCPPPPQARLTWPPDVQGVAELRRLSGDGNAHAGEMLAAAEGGVIASPEAIDWYIKRAST